jgi:hypothetical protein
MAKVENIGNLEEVWGLFLAAGRWMLVSCFLSLVYPDTSVTYPHELSLF